MDEDKQIVVTGIGIVSSLGIGRRTFWKNILAGKSNISRISSFDSTPFRTHKAGEIKDFDPSRFMKNPADKGRATQLLLAAAQLALKDAHLSIASLNPYEVSTLVGTTALEPSAIGALNKARLKKGLMHISPQLITNGIIRTTSVVMARELGLKGFISVIPTACSAGNYAIGLGHDLIKAGRSKVALCCGVDMFFRSIFAGFDRLFILAPDYCRPFDKERKGTILGEGAAVLVLESLGDALKRKADVYARVLGYGLSCDAHSMTIPSKFGIKRVMEKAINNAGIRKEDVDYINAHGSGTLNNDREEAAAIKMVFGKKTKKIPVSSIKSMLGHTLGAASAMEAASCCLSIKDDIIPPTINYNTPDPECDLNIVANKSLKKKINIAMNNSFAFGGNNACVVFGKI